MKLKSLLLGSVAAAGMSTGAYAADLGSVVLSALSVCDALNITGLTIASDTNCLKISGGVAYEANVSSDGADIWWDSLVEAWLDFEGSSDSSFGKATAFISFDFSSSVWHTYTITGSSITSWSSTWTFWIDEAYVSIGDTTVLTFGLTGSVANLDQDEGLDYFGGYFGDGVFTDIVDDLLPAGDHVIQVAHDLGNGVDVAFGIEGLDNTSGPSFVGVINYSGDGFSGHVTTLADIWGNWGIHAGIEGEFDMFEFVAAAAFDSASDMAAMASISVALDLLTFALTGEYSDVAGVVVMAGTASVEAEVADGVTLSLAGGIADNNGTIEMIGEAAVDFAITETLTAGAFVNYFDDGAAVITFGGNLTWEPNDDTSVELSAEADSTGVVTAGVAAEKEFI